MKNYWFLFLASLAVLSACLPAQPSSTSGQTVETLVSSTLQAMTAMPQLEMSPTPVQSRGLPVSYENVSFTIPLELNSSAVPSRTTDVEFPYINPSGGPMAAHLVFQITNYPAAGSAKIMVFRSSEYAAYGPPTQDAVTALLAGQDTLDPLPDALSHNFLVQRKTVSFQNGHGVRYLTQVMTNFAPVTNQDLFYYYQGITNDGAYYLAAIFHVTAPFLAADGNPNSAVPPDGIPFTPNGANPDFSKYLGDVTLKLNDTPPENFTVPLTFLDKLIESIQIINQ